MAEAGKIIKLTGDVKAVNELSEKSLNLGDIVLLNDTIKTIGENASVDIELSSGRVLHIAGDNVAKLDKSILSNDSFENEAAIDDKINSLINNIVNNNGEIELDATAAGDAGATTATGTLNDVVFAQSGSESEVYADVLSREVDGAIITTNNTINGVNLEQVAEEVANVVIPETKPEEKPEEGNGEDITNPDNGNNNPEEGNGNNTPEEKPEEGNGDNNQPETKPEAVDANINLDIFDNKGSNIENTINNNKEIIISGTINPIDANGNKVEINTDKVTITINGDKVSATINPDGSFTINYAPNKDGEIKVEVSYDLGNGNVVKEDASTIVDITAPEITDSKAEVVDDNIVISGKTEPEATITAPNGDKVVADKDGNFEITIPNNGDNKVEISVTDKVGNTNENTTTIDVIQPEVKPEAPLFDNLIITEINGDETVSDDLAKVDSDKLVINGKLENFTGKAGDYEFNITSNIIGSDSNSTKVIAKVDENGNFTFTLDTNVTTNDQGAIRVEFDGKTDTVRVESVATKPETPETPADTEAPVISGVTATPTEDGKFVIEGNTEPDAVVTITKPDGSKEEVKADANGDFKFELDNVKDGDKFDLVARDEAGNVSNSVDVVASIPNTETPETPADTEAPVISGVTATPTEDGKFVIEGNTEPDAVVTITKPDGSKEEVKADANGDFKFELDNVKDGDKFDLVARDEAGNVSNSVDVVASIPNTETPEEPVNPTFDSLIITEINGDETVSDDLAKVDSDKLVINGKLENFTGKAGDYEFNITSNIIGSDSNSTKVIAKVDENGNFTFTLDTNVTTNDQGAIRVEFDGKTDTVRVESVATKPEEPAEINVELTYKDGSLVNANDTIKDTIIVKGEVSGIPDGTKLIISISDNPYDGAGIGTVEVVNGKFELPFTPEQGIEGKFVISAFNKDYGSSTTIEFNIDTKAPVLEEITGTPQEDGSYVVSGKTEPNTTVIINGKETTSDANGEFNLSLENVANKDKITIEAVDKVGNKSSSELIAGIVEIPSNGMKVTIYTGNEGENGYTIDGQTQRQSGESETDRTPTFVGEFNGKGLQSVLVNISNEKGELVATREVFAMDGKFIFTADLECNKFGDYTYSFVVFGSGIKGEVVFGYVDNQVSSDNNDNSNNGNTDNNQGSSNGGIINIEKPEVPSVENKLNVKVYEGDETGVFNNLKELANGGNTYDTTPTFIGNSGAANDTILIAIEKIDGPIGTAGWKDLGIVLTDENGNFRYTHSFTNVLEANAWESGTYKVSLVSNATGAKQEYTFTIVPNLGNDNTQDNTNDAMKVTIYTGNEGENGYTIDGQTQRQSGESETDRTPTFVGEFNGKGLQSVLVNISNEKGELVATREVFAMDGKFIFTADLECNKFGDYTYSFVVFGSGIKGEVVFGYVDNQVSSDNNDNSNNGNTDNNQGSSNGGIINIEKPEVPSVENKLNVKVYEGDETGVFNNLKELANGGNTYDTTPTFIGNSGAANDTILIAIEKIDGPIGTAGWKDLGIVLTDENGNFRYTHSFTNVLEANAWESGTYKVSLVSNATGAKQEYTFTIVPNLGNDNTQDNTTNDDVIVDSGNNQGSSNGGIINIEIPSHNDGQAHSITIDENIYYQFNNLSPLEKINGYDTEHAPAIKGSATPGMDVLVYLINETTGEKVYTQFKVSQSGEFDISLGGEAGNSYHYEIYESVECKPVGEPAVSHSFNVVKQNSFIEFDKGILSADEGLNIPEIKNEANKNAENEVKVDDILDTQKDIFNETISQAGKVQEGYINISLSAYDVASKELTQIDEFNKINHHS